MPPSPVFTLTLTSEARSTRTATASMTKTKTSPSIISTLTRTFKRKSKSTRTAPSPAPAASKWVPLTPAEAYAIMQAEGFTGRYPPFAINEERRKIARARPSEEKEPQITLEHTLPVTSSVDAPVYIRIRNRSFLRAVFHTNYLKYQLVILIVQLKYLIQHSPEAEFYTLFTYKDAIVRFNVHATSELDPRWAYEVGRAARSEGRIEMHLVSLSEDENADWRRYFPLQSSNGMLQAGLRRLAAEIRRGKQLFWDTEVKALIDATADKSLLIFDFGFPSSTDLKASLGVSRIKSHAVRKAPPHHVIRKDDPRAYVPRRHPDPVGEPSTFGPPILPRPYRPLLHNLPGVRSPQWHGQHWWESSVRTFGSNSNCTELNAKFRFRFNEMPEPEPEVRFSVRAEIFFVEPNRTLNLKHTWSYDFSMFHPTFWLITSLKSRLWLPIWKLAMLRRRRARSDECALTVSSRAILALAAHWNFVQQLVWIEASVNEKAQNHRIGARMIDLHRRYSDANNGSLARLKLTRNGVFHDLGYTPPRPSPSEGRYYPDSLAFSVRVRFSALYSTISLTPGIRKDLLWESGQITPKKGPKPPKKLCKEH
ncbi:hypothetical protein DFH06DRAFT_1304228 [Mycena polygramma]|nr:hypothetical protein DFH06DRAFT_1304228 [Mycena polygramma]